MMNKLYDVIDPPVLDDALLRLALSETPESTEAVKNGQDIDLSEVKTLKISFKKIRKISNLKGFNNLTKLQLDNNQIERIENISHLIHLTWLDLSFNRIKKLEGLEGLTKLTDLSLYKNEITELEGIDSLVKLEVLSLGRNKITQLSRLLYLRRFRHLAVLNLEGNPVCTSSEYRSFVLARVSRGGELKYLDYRMVDETAVRLAREQYQDELRDVLGREKEEDEQEVQDSLKEERLTQLKEAGLLVFDNLHQDLMREDTELPKLLVLKPLVEVHEEYRDKLNELARTFVVQMLEHYHVRRKERDTFKKACERVQRESDNRCVGLIEDYNRKKKKALRELTSDAQGVAQVVQGLRASNLTLYDTLMETEMEIVEQFEEFIREFETKLGEQNAAAVETIRACFEKVRELETNFYERIMQLAMLELGKFNKNELPHDISSDAKELLSDKETLSNLINSSHDIQTLFIESKDDEITKHVAATLDAAMSQVKEDEHRRNTARLSEVTMLRHRNDAQLSDFRVKK